jgi:hypothetical protein
MGHTAGAPPWAPRIGSPGPPRMVRRIGKSAIVLILLGIDKLYSLGAKGHNI